MHAVVLRNTVEFSRQHFHVGIDFRIDDTRIDLRRADVRMPQHSTDGFDRDAVCKGDRRGKRMPGHVNNLP